MKTSPSVNPLVWLATELVFWVVCLLSVTLFCWCQKKDKETFEPTDLP